MLKKMFFGFPKKKYVFKKNQLFFREKLFFSDDWAPENMFFLGKVFFNGQAIDRKNQLFPRKNMFFQKDIQAMDRKQKLGKVGF